MSRRRVRQRGAGQLLDGDVVDDFFVDQDAAVAVRRVLAEADVGDDEEPRHFLLDRARRGLYRCLGIVGARAHRILLIRQTEQEHAGHPVGLGGGRLAHGLVDRQLEDAGHRTHFAAFAFAGADEERVDEVVRRQAGLADERANRRCAPQAPRTVAQ